MFWRLGLSIVLAGCAGPAEEISLLKTELADLSSQDRRLRDTVAAQQATIETLQQQNERLIGLGQDRFDRIYRASRIEISRYSGGTDLDGTLGDEGLTIYLKLYDQDGHDFKAAGEIDVHVYDLQNREQPELIAHCHYDESQARELWYGRLMTYHYKLPCLWQARPPTGRQITVTVTFLDTLTGHALRTTKQLEITPAAAPSALQGS